MAVMTDPDFLAEADKLGLPIEAARGDEVDELIKAALQQSPETVAIIANALSVEIPTIKATSEILGLEDRNKVVTFMSGDATRHRRGVGLAHRPDASTAKRPNATRWRSA